MNFISKLLEKIKNKFTPKTSHYSEDFSETELVINKPAKPKRYRPKKKKKPE